MCSENSKKKKGLGIEVDSLLAQYHNDKSQWKVSAVCLLYVFWFLNMCMCVSPASFSATGIAPNITAGPSDSAVIDGMSIILHCETSGAPRPAITWQKGQSPISHLSQRKIFISVSWTYEH